jgi:hypothetical protein
MWACLLACSCVRKIDLWPYAVKVLPRCNSANDRERVLQEIYAFAAQGDNPHTVRYYNAWEEDDVVYIQVCQEFHKQHEYTECLVAGTFLGATYKQGPWET